MPHVSPEEKVIICCKQLGGLLEAIEARAHLVTCCEGSAMSNAAAMIVIAEQAHEQLSALLAEDLEHEDD